MDRKSLLNKLEEFGIGSKKAYMAKAFSRNIGLLTQAEQEKLSNTTIAIPGMGGVGGVHLITMVRTGIGRFHLSDFDTYEPVNINRQFGAKVPDFGRPKMQVMKEHALSINPYIEIKEFPEGINDSNIDNFLDGVQVVLDGLDFFAFETRRLLFNRAREKGIYVITAGPMGFSSAMLIFSPNKGMSFDEYFNIIEGMSEWDQHLAFFIGIAPRATHLKYMDISRVDLDAKGGPSLNIGCQICAGMAATEAVRIILNRGRIKPVPHFFQFDPYLQKYRKGYIVGGNRNPIQQLKKRAVGLLLLRNKARYRPSAPEIPTVKSKQNKVPEEIIHYIIRAGIQAPSGDNAQPWKFSFEGNTIFLYLDRDADRSFFNINQIASIISCGAVIENIRIAASAFGFKTNISYISINEKDDLIAEVQLIHGEKQKNPLSDFIWERHTNRKAYDKRPLSASILAELQESISGFSGVRLHVVTNEKNIKKLAELIYRADRIRTEHRTLHEHLCQMIRYTHEEASKKRDGLPLKNLEAGLAGEVFLKLTRSWQIMNIANRFGLGRMVAFHSFQGMINSSGAALLTVDGMDTKDFLKGGRALERIWLTATKKGLFLQPMTAITLFWLRWQLKGEKSFAMKHRKLLSGVWEQYHILFSEMDFSGNGHVMLFRLGYGKKSKHGTYRKDIGSFLR